MFRISYLNLIFGIYPLRQLYKKVLLNIAYWSPLALSPALRIEIEVGRSTADLISNEIYATGWKSY